MVASACVGSQRVKSLRLVEKQMFDWNLW